MRTIDADHLRRWILSRVFKTQLSVADVIDQIDRENTIKPRCETCEAFNKTRLLIPQPQRTGRWINHVEDGYVECPFCHSATNCDDNISDLHFCFSCGARMEGE